MDGRGGVGYSSSMILLPLILAASSPAPQPSESLAYGTCVLLPIIQWSTGPDAAEVIVRTAEQACTDEREKVRLEALRFIESRPDGAKLSSSVKLSEAERLTRMTEERVRGMAFGMVLNARTKTAPQVPAKVP